MLIYDVCLDFSVWSTIDAIESFGYADIVLHVWRRIVVGLKMLTT